MDSIVNQTLKDIEIICVDDGSTDDSMVILQEYTAKDNRVHILKQENKGGGAARNYGLSAAMGKYVIFLDSDDFFNPGLLNKLYVKADVNEADIAICCTQTYYHKLKRISPIIGGIELWQCPDKEIFNYEDMPAHIFTAFRFAPFNKLYLRNFLVENHLSYQEVMRVNDLYFAETSLIRAKRIVIVEESLVYYREGHGGNCVATHYKHPLGVYDALLSSKLFHIENGYWETIKISYLNQALSACIRVIFTRLRGYSEQKDVYNFFKTEGFANLGFNEIAPSQFQNPVDYEQYKLIMSMKYEELFSHAGQIKQRMKLLPRKIKQSTNSLQSYIKSYGYIKTLKDRLNNISLLIQLKLTR